MEIFFRSDQRTPRIQSKAGKTVVTYSVQTARQVRQRHRALTGGISKHPYDEAWTDAFVMAQPVRSTTNTTSKARRSIEKLLHPIFRAALIVLSSAFTFRPGKNSRSAQHFNIGEAVTS
jgi:hypothetical protein